MIALEKSSNFMSGSFIIQEHIFFTVTMLTSVVATESTHNRLAWSIYGLYNITVYTINEGYSLIPDFEAMEKNCRI